MSELEELELQHYFRTIAELSLIENAPSKGNLWHLFGKRVAQEEWLDELDMLANTTTNASLRRRCVKILLQHRFPEHRIYG